MATDAHSSTCKMALHQRQQVNYESFPSLFFELQAFPPPSPPWTSPLLAILNRNSSPSPVDEVVCSSADSSRGNSPPEVQLNEDQPRAPDVAGEDELVPDLGQPEEGVVQYIRQPTCYYVQEVTRCVRLAFELFVVGPDGSMPSVNLRSSEGVGLLLDALPRTYRRFFRRLARGATSLEEVCERVASHILHLWFQNRRSMGERRAIRSASIAVAESAGTEYGDRNDADGRREVKELSEQFYETVATPSSKIPTADAFMNECSCRYSFFANCACKPKPYKTYDLFRGSKDYLRDYLDEKKKAEQQQLRSMDLFSWGFVPMMPPALLPVPELKHEGSGTNEYKKYDMFGTPNFANFLESSSASAQLPAQNASNLTSHQPTFSLFRFEHSARAVEANPRSNDDVPCPSYSADDNNNSVDESCAPSEVVEQIQMPRQVAGARGPSGPVAVAPVPLPSPLGNLKVSGANSNGEHPAFEPYVATVFEATIDELLTRKCDSAAAAASCEEESASASGDDESVTFAPIDPSNTVPVDAPPVLERSESGAYYDEQGKKFLQYRSSTESQSSLGEAEFVPKFEEVGKNAESQTSPGKNAENQTSPVDEEGTI